MKKVFLYIGIIFNGLLMLLHFYNHVVNSFAFPTIDRTSGESEYRFVAGTSPRYSNPSGNIIECSMQWEEV